MNEIHHVVWDWNGTLLDDTALTVRAAADALAAIGQPRELTLRGWRQVATRPLQSTYEKLIGAPITDDQWQTLIAAWFKTYLNGLDDVALNPTARQALDEVAARGMTQSIVSLHKETELLAHTTALGVTTYFTHISGVTWGDNFAALPSKAIMVQNQLTTLGLAPAQALMIGDMTDDGNEAHQAGVPAVLVTTGDTSRERLLASGYPVADSLLEAIRTVPFDTFQPGDH